VQRASRHDVYLGWCVAQIPGNVYTPKCWHMCHTLKREVTVMSGIFSKALGVLHSDNGSRLSLRTLDNVYEVVQSELHGMIAVRPRCQPKPDRNLSSHRRTGRCQRLGQVGRACRTELVDMWQADEDPSTGVVPSAVQGTRSLVQVLNVRSSLQCTVS